MQNERRYDIDALRVLAFAVLILYHTAMYYVADWGWHIKSAFTYEWLQDVMILTNPWRMSLLFFISGLALALSVHKFKALTLVKLKTIRLFVPLVFGMFVIVSPQVYFEALSQNIIEPGFWQFWLAYINPNTHLLAEHHGPIGLLTWNHLWFLPYVWAYCLITIAIKPLLSRVAQSRTVAKVPLPMMLAACIVMLILVWWMLRTSFPTTHDLINDWYNHGKYFLVFIVGYIFALQKSWWRAVITHHRATFVIALLCYAFIIADRHGVWSTLASLYDSNAFVKLFYGLVHSANHWLWIFTMVGMAGFYLNKPSRFFSYTNRAILPYYMLHQTLIIIIAWFLKALQLHPRIEALLVIVLTIGACVLSFEVIKRNTLLAGLFGIKAEKIPSKAQKSMLKQTA